MARHAVACTESRCSLQHCRFRQHSRSTKTRSPTASAHRRRPIIHLAETSPALFRKSSSAISGFRSLGGREQHSFSHCAHKDLCVLEPLIGGAKVPLVSFPLSSGASRQPWTDVVTGT